MSAAMNKDELFNSIKQILVDEFDKSPEAVTPTADFVKDLEMDSLELVEFIMALEKLVESKFGLKVEISDDQARSIKNMRGAVDYLYSLMATNPT